MDTSFVFSILKCEFGWNGCTPDSMSNDDFDKVIARHQCASCCANELALLLDMHGTHWVGRIDGRANTRFVGAGVVYGWKARVNPRTFAHCGMIAAKR